MRRNAIASFIIRMTGVCLLLLFAGLVFPYGAAAEERTVSEMPVSIEFYDGNEIAYRFFPEQTIGESYVMPGLPDTVRKTDSLFSYYCTDANGNGEKIYPGDTILLTDVCTKFFISWEPSVTQCPEVQTIRTFVQEFQKTSMIPNSFTTQGGTLVVRDGKKYWVQLGVREITEETKNSHAVDVAMNYTAIFIYDYETGEVLNTAFNIPFGHGNDLEYNPHLDRFVICSALEEGEALTEVNWQLTEYKCFSPEGTKGFRTVDCAYDGQNQNYILTLAPLDSNYLKDSVSVLRYDEDWHMQGTTAAPFAIPENHYGFQGGCIYEGYYYLINFLKDNFQESGTASFKYARVSIYDCDTLTYAGSLPIMVSDEIEDITIIGQTAYLNGQVYKEGSLYKYHIYEIDFSELSMIPHQEETTTPVETTTISTTDTFNTTKTTSAVTSETTTSAAASVTETTGTIVSSICTGTSTMTSETGCTETCVSTHDKEASLPQTGNRSLKIFVIVIMAFTLTFIGVFVIVRSEVLFKRKKSHKL